MINHPHENRREHPIAHRDDQAKHAVSLVKSGCKYVVTRCLDESLRTTTYEDSLHRQENVIGGTTEYFRPNALAIDMHLAPGDLIDVLEVDHEHGFVHAFVTMIRGQRYELSRVIPLHGHTANPETVIVAPMLEGDGVPAPIGAPHVPSETAELTFAETHEDERVLVA